MKKEDVAKQFCDRATEKGKKIITGNTPGCFYYESWYSDPIRFDDNGLCHVRLDDLARHSDFYDFIIEMQSEKVVEIIISDTISLGTCETHILKKEYEGIGLTEGEWVWSPKVNSWSPEGNKWKTETLLSIAHELNALLSHYSIVVEDAKLCVKAQDEASKHAIIHNESLFKDDMVKVKAYIDEHKDDILQKLKLAAKEEKKALWHKESLMGMVAQKLKEIVSPRGETIHVFYDSDTLTYKDKIKYKDRELSVWAIYPYSEVGDYDIGEPVYYAKLADIALCPEFKQAIEKVQEEEGIAIHSNGGIDLNDCLFVAGHSPVDYEGIAKRLHLDNEADLYNFWLKVCGDLHAFLKPEFKLYCHKNYGEVKLMFNEVYGLRQQDIIECSPMFKNKMQKVADYFDEHFK